MFFPFSIKASRCSGGCNNINHLYAKICDVVRKFSDVVRNLSIKAFNQELMKQDT